MDLGAVKLQLLSIALGSPRMIVFFSVVPLLGPDILPSLIRNGFVVALSLFLSPLISSQLSADFSLPSLFAMIVKEAALGLFIGFPVSLIFITPMAVGNLIEQQTGGGNSGGNEPGSGLESTTSGTLLYQMLVALFMVSGGMQLLLQGLLGSYRVWPTAAFVPRLDAAALALFTEASARFLLSALLLAAPMLILGNFLEICMGFLGRFAQSLNVHYLSMPLKAMVSKLLLVALLWILSDRFTAPVAGLQELFDTLFQTVPPHE